MCSSINALPHELLGEIFTHCSAICPDAPLILGQVTRLFRHIAHTTPSVWSNLRLAETDTDERGCAKATLWLTRSEACPITVDVHIPAISKKADSHQPLSLAAVDLLREHTRRIWGLWLHTDTQAQARAVLAAVYGEKADDTGLRILRVCVATATTSAAAMGTLAFPAIPSVVELETTNVALSALPALDLAQLEHLRILQPLVSAPVAAEDILALADVAPRLRILHVETRIADPVPTTDTHFLDHLTELNLRANNLVPLLDRLIVPSLHALHLRDLDGARFGASHEMGAALHRLLVRMELGDGDVRQNELRVLELVGMSVELGDAVWQRCIQRMKRLEVFTVNGPGEIEQPEMEEIVRVEETREVKTGFPREVKTGFPFGFGACHT